LQFNDLSQIIGTRYCNDMYNILLPNLPKATSTDALIA